jgi:2-oxo-4-hydroxy-4-carboxy-5-ureidoimidazoline decarboxylase
VISIERLNQMNKQEFMDTVGWVFEDSPWVAERAWESMPLTSGAELFQTMVTIVEKAETSLKLSLLRAHPDLGTRLLMSEASQKEQGEAGLKQLSNEERLEFLTWNKAYVEKFGFPFIMAVKGQGKETILATMKQRLNSTKEKEFEMALKEVYKIAKFRLDDFIQ